MNQALIIIDYTNDFVASDGALTAGHPAQVLHDYIYSLIETFADRQDMIAFMVDLHHENDRVHPETALFPPHNIKGTVGRSHYGQVEALYQTIKDHPKVMYRDKTRYSAFAGTDLTLRLREQAIDTIHLVGVVTDICVLHTAIDAYNLGFKIVIHEKGVASFDPKGHEWALNHFKQVLGAEIV